MKGFILVLCMLVLSACNLTAKQTAGPIEDGYQQQHTQIDFDMYPACNGSCRK